jgi:hypothetical protein
VYYHPNRVSVAPTADGVSHVTIRPGEWSFDGASGVSYDLRIDQGKPVVGFDLMRPGQTEPYGRGLIRREGRAIRVIYQWGARPTGFTDQPGDCELLLVRE